MTYIIGDIYPSDWEVVSEQLVIGVSRDRMTEFQQHRAAKIKQLTEDTKKLELKMEKLGDGQKSLTKRMNVKLLKSKLSGDAASTHCSACEDLVLLTKKRCKLCEAVLCRSCSKYSDFDDAKAALLPSAPVTLKAEKKVKKLRLCAKCEHLVELRKPCAQEYDVTLVSMHDQMRDLIDASRPVLEIYSTIKQSLLEGQSTYSLSDAKSLRDRLGKMGEGIVDLSRRIAALPAAPGSRHARLQAYIRMAASHYVKDHLLPMQLPTQAQIDEARQKRFALKSARPRKKPAIYFIKGR